MIADLRKALAEIVRLRTDLATQAIATTLHRERADLAEATLAKVTKARTRLIEGHWYVSADDLRKIDGLGSYVPEEVSHG